MSRTSLVLVVLIAACGGGGGSGMDSGLPAGGLSVMGTITAMDTATSRMDFSTRTALVDDRGASMVGDTIGHCTITRSTDGGPDRVDVAVAQTGGMLDSGIHQLEVRLDDTRPGSLAGVMTAALGPADPTGGHTYVGGPGSMCMLTLTYSASTATASITLPPACMLVNGLTAAPLGVSGTLSFAGCSVD